jgi:hypothetical protein
MIFYSDTYVVNKSKINDLRYTLANHFMIQYMYINDIGAVLGIENISYC